MTETAVVVLAVAAAVMGTAAGAEEKQRDEKQEKAHRTRKPSLHIRRRTQAIAVLRGLWECMR